MHVLTRSDAPAGPSNIFPTLPPTGLTVPIIKEDRALICSMGHRAIHQNTHVFDHAFIQDFVVVQWTSYLLILEITAPIFRKRTAGPQNRWHPQGKAAKSTNTPIGICTSERGLKKLTVGG